MEKFLNKMERKIGRFAIPHLIIYICGLYIVGLVISLVNPVFYSQYLSLDVSAILKGEIWRIFTFLVQAPDSNVIFFIFVLYLYYMIGMELERTWGTFRFNVYYFTGVIFTILGAFIAYAITGQVYATDTYYLNMSMFLAYAFVYPDTELLLFFLIPIKIKWLAYIDMAFFVYVIVVGDMGTKLSAVLALMNFIIFFFGFMKKNGKTPKQAYRRYKYQKAVRRPPQSRTDAARGAHKGRSRGYGDTGAMVHKCAVCGRTSITNPELEFRFCSKCNGNYEYCQDHLFNHEHVK